MKNFIAHQNGSIALTTLILITGLLISTGITVVLTAVDLRNSTVNFNKVMLARLYSRTCLEESVNRLKFNPSFTGDVTVDFSNGSCTSTVTANVDPDLRDLAIVSQVDEFTFNDLLQLDASNYPFEIIR